MILQAPPSLPETPGTDKRYKISLGEYVGFLAGRLNANGERGRQEQDYTTCKKCESRSKFENRSCIAIVPYLT